ncbi:hypothetical protein AVEN_258031-1, partial [Araneus ventricosus]
THQRRFSILIDIRTSYPSDLFDRNNFKKQKQTRHGFSYANSTTDHERSPGETPFFCCLSSKPNCHSKIPLEGTKSKKAPKESTPEHLDHDIYLPSSPFPYHNTIKMRSAYPTPFFIFSHFGSGGSGTTSAGQTISWSACGVTTQDSPIGIPRVPPLDQTYCGVRAHRSSSAFS